MLGEEEYASSTDESDEDYNPNANDSDAASEVESDGEAEDPIHDDETDNTRRLGRKRKAASVNETTTKTRRSTAANESKKEETKTEDKPLEGDDDDDDDDDEDAMWASFLNKSAATAPPQIAKVTQLVAQGQSSNPKQVTVTKEPQPAKTESVPVKVPEKKKIVTEIFEFAGEKVEVKKEVKMDESDQKATSSFTADVSQATNRPSGFRPGARTSGGGLSSVLGHIGKKNKLSVLEKTHLDWSGFKQKEGIDEELQTHNRGRDGFLERQDFLERTDLRRFEIEKNMRHTTRRK